MNNYKKGQVVEIVDRVTLESSTIGTIQLVEEDDEIAGLSWLYVRSNNEEDNIQYDERIGNYWCVSESTSEYITILADS